MGKLRIGAASLVAALAISSCAFDLPDAGAGSMGAGGANILVSVGSTSASTTASSGSGSVSSASSTASAGGGGASGGSSSTSAASSSASGGASSSSSSGGQGGGGNPTVEGCADGFREAYDVMAEPCIAGCDGAFLVPGVNVGPKCGRQGGNTSAHPDGATCAAEDLCAPGWHLCVSEQEVSSKAKSHACPTATVDARFYTTRQGEDDSFNCAPQPADNNVLGCGWGASIGTSTVQCGPLNMYLKANVCDMNGVWSCGSDGFHEGAFLTKNASSHGGALCCRDDGQGGC